MKTKPFPMSALVLSIPWKPCFAGFVSVTSDETSVFSLWNDAELSVKSAPEIIKNLPPQDFISLNDLISVVEALQKYWPESPFVLQVRFTFHQLYETSINGGVCWVSAQVSFSRIESVLTKWQKLQLPWQDQVYLFLLPLENRRWCGIMILTG